MPTISGLFRSAAASPGSCTYGTTKSPLRQGVGYSASRTIAGLRQYDQHSGRDPPQPSNRMIRKAAQALRVMERKEVGDAAWAEKGLPVCSPVRCSTLSFYYRQEWLIKGVSRCSISQYGFIIPPLSCAISWFAFVAESLICYLSSKSHWKLRLANDKLMMQNVHQHNHHDLVHRLSHNV